MAGLSALQKYILTVSFASRGRAVTKEALLDFYRQAGQAKPDDVQGIVTRSVERLIERGLVTVRGTKTPKKLFITDVQLTPLGRKRARALLGEQQALPLRKIYR